MMRTAISPRFAMRRVLRFSMLVMHPFADFKIGAF